MARPDRLAPERGVTLTELLVALAIFGLVMAGVITTWTKAQEAYFVGSDVAELQQNVRTALDFMVREIQSTGRDATVCAFDYAFGGGTDCTNAKVTRCTTQLTAISATQSTFYNSINGCQSVFAIPVADATTTRLRIRADRNDNGSVARETAADPDDPNNEDVIYELRTGSPCPTGVPACITRHASPDSGATSPEAMIAVDVSTLIFEYFPKAGLVAGCTVAAGPCNAFTPSSQADADAIQRIRITVKAFSQVAGNDVYRTLVSDVMLKNR